MRLLLLVALSLPLLQACKGPQPTDVEPPAAALRPAATPRETREPVNAWLHRRTFKRDLIKYYGHARYLNLFAAQIWAESRWKSDARSWAGAFGCGQFMPATQGDAKLWAADLGRIDWANCEQSGRASIRYMRSIHRRITPPDTSDRATAECYVMRETLADYNRGMGHGDRERRSGVCMRSERACAETDNYVSKIVGPYQDKFFNLAYGDTLICR